MVRRKWKKWRKLIDRLNAICRSHFLDQSLPVNLISCRVLYFVFSCDRAYIDLD